MESWIEDGSSAMSELADALGSLSDAFAGFVESIHAVLSA